MITVSLSKTAKDGSSYFSEDDGYYVSPPGTSKWYGRGAEKLGLLGEVNKLELDTVLRGYNPQTGAKLVANADAEDVMNASGKVVKRGRIAYIDVHAAVPKSASILSLIDPQIEQAHNRAVEKAIALLEAEYTFTRREESGIIQTVKSDNLVIAKINHYESRDLDPQLHSHLVVMNLTCGDDEKWRSIDAGKIYQDQQYLGQMYRNELAKGLKQIGYEIEVTNPEKGLFEIKGVEPDVIEKYSKRRKAIEKKLEEYEEKHIYTHLKPRARAQKACLATRRKKQRINPEKLREALASEFAEAGQPLSSLRDVALRHGASAPGTPPRSAEECIRLAINDVMDKQAAASENTIIKSALKGGMGYYTAEHLSAVLRDQPDWETLGPGVGDRYPTTYYTTTETRRAEQAVIDYARRDRGRYGRAIAATTMDKHMTRFAAEGKHLSTGQYKSVQMVCTARDRVSIIQGDAGAGKTYAMETVRDILAAEGIGVRGFAPTGKASEELNATGVKAMTIHSYLESPNAQADVGQGEVWLVDEAGMIGSLILNDFLNKAAEKQARVILIGDDKQFQSVEQGKIFQSLQDKRAVQKTEITEVQRQKTEHAKTVVKAIKDKDYDTAFRTLDRHNGLKEIADRDTRIKYIVNEYLDDRQNGTKSVVLTANNADKDEINSKIRANLAAKGIVNAGNTFEMYQKNDINSIAKTFGRAYTDGQIIIARRDCGDIPRGTQATITKIDTDNDTISVKFYNKKTKQMDYKDIDLRKNAANLDVYNRFTKHFGAGDSVIFTKNDKRVGVSNGQTGTIINIDNDGNAKIQVGKKTVECNLHNRGDKGYTYVDYAYCLTNHKSQGSTYDKVVVNADVSHQKTNYNAFYVQATRSKYDIVIVTDDKNKLAEQAAIRENKISTLDPIFEEFTLKQQERAAEIRAEEAEYTKNAAKAAHDRIIDRITKDLNKAMPSPQSIWWLPKNKNNDNARDRLEKIQNTKGSAAIDELKKTHTERYAWIRSNPINKGQDGNYIVAHLHDNRATGHANDQYITAQPQTNGGITYWASVGILKNTDNKTETSKPFTDMDTVKTMIDEYSCKLLLTETLKNIEQELAKQKEQERETTAAMNKSNDHGYSIF